MRKFVLQNEKSHKFWSVEINDRAVSVRYGRVGTVGQATTKNYDTVQKATGAVNKLIREKTDKGYVEALSPGMPDEHDTQQRALDDLLQAKELQKALVHYFAFLCDTPGWGVALTQIMAKAVSASVDDKVLKVSFGGGEQLLCQPPASEGAYASWPASFRNIVKHHEHLSFPDNAGWGINLGDVGTFESQFLEDTELAAYQKDMLVPLGDYSDWWLYSPTEKLQSGEPALHFFSHESCEVDAPSALNLGALFLSRMADCLDLEIEMPEVGAPNACGISAGPHLGAHGEPCAIIGMSFEPNSNRFAYIDNSILIISQLVARHVATEQARIDLGNVDDNELRFHWHASRLVITTRTGFFVVALSDDGKIELLHAYGDDWGRNAAHVERDRVIFNRHNHNYIYSLRHKGEYLPVAYPPDIPGGEKEPCNRHASILGHPQSNSTDGLHMQRFDGGTESIEPLSNPFGTCLDIVAIGDRLYVICQNHTMTYKVAASHPPKYEGYVRHSFCWPKIFANAGRQAIIVLEMVDDDKYAFNWMSVSGKKPKITTRLFPRHTVVAADCFEEGIWLLVCDKKRNHFFTHINTLAGEPVMSAGPIPVDKHADLDRLKIVSMKVTAGIAQIFIKDGRTLLMKLSV